MRPRRQDLTAKPRYAVLLDDPEILITELQAVAKIVAEALGERTLDTALRMRYGHGILVRDVPGLHAKMISRLLAKRGHGSFAVELGPGGLRTTPRAKRTGTLTITDSGLELAVRFKPPKTFEWSQIQAIHAHALSVVSNSDEGEPLARSRGNPQTPGGAKLIKEIRLYEERERVRIHIGMDILLDGPALFRVKFDTPGIYSTLEGRADNAWDNFLLLLESLLERAEGVLIPPTTRRLLVRHEFNDVLYTKPEELENFNAWLLHARERGITYGEPEDLDDEVLSDEDEAVALAGDDDDDADDIDDAELEDSLDPDADAPAVADDEPADEVPELDDAEDLSDEDLSDEDLGDEDVSDVLEHFDKTKRVDITQLQAMLEDAKDLDDLDESTDPDGEDVQDALQHFETSSGAWDVQQLRDDAQE